MPLKKDKEPVILQNGQSVAYESRALNNPETCYAQNVKELLAVIFGLEKIHEFTYARPVAIQSDHKPYDKRLYSRNHY